MFSRRRRALCNRRAAPRTDTRASDPRRLQVHEDRGSNSASFVAKRAAAEAPVRGRWREGVREKAKSFVLPLPPTRAEGKCLSRREVRTVCNHCCTAATCTAAHRDTLNSLQEGHLHFLFADLPPSAQFLLRAANTAQQRRRQRGCGAPLTVTRWT